MDPRCEVRLSSRRLRSSTRPGIRGEAVAKSVRVSTRAGGWVTAVVVLLAVAATGCSSDDPSTSPVPTTPSPTATSLPEQSESEVAAEEAVDAYLGFREAQEAAGAIPDPFYEDLELYATGEALAVERATLLDLAEQDVAIRGSAVYEPVVIDVRLSKLKSVSIEDCVDTAEVTAVNTRTGESVLAGDQPTRVLSTATVEPVGGTWKVSRIDTDRSGEC